MELDISTLPVKLNAISRSPSSSQLCIPDSLLTVKGRFFSVGRKVAIALMYLATGCTLSVVSEKFGCGISTVSKIVDNFLDAMILRITNVIKWPSNPEDVQRTKVGMQSAQGLPNCMGAIDCTYVKMERLANELATNCPANDKRVLQNSSLFRLAQANQRLHGSLFQQQGYAIREYILGDGGYYHLPWLLTPFQEPCIRSQSRYNYRVSSSRMVVERAFGRLKNAWRILDGVIKNPIVIKVPKIIAVCCMLHNLAINHGMAFDNEMDADLTAYHVDLNIAGSDIDDDAINAETITMYLDEIHGTHM
ncbi:hypothetical protein L7F22_060628 [Adiantum nelumboides]|nr:hypothetical protein [Adiantum nelumboides]